jgi:hypothetical protein
MRAPQRFAAAPSPIARAGSALASAHRLYEGAWLKRIRHLTAKQVHVGSTPTAPSRVCMGDWQRWLMHSPLKRDQAGSIPAGPQRAALFARAGAERHPPSFAGLADVAMHSPFKRDEAGSIPASRTIYMRALHSTGSGQSLLSSECRFESGSAFQTGVPGTRGFSRAGKGDVVQRIEGARLRTGRSEFNSLHPFQIQIGSRGLTHDDASVLTKRSGLESRREFHLFEGSATLRCYALAKSSRRTALPFRSPSGRVV